MSLKGKTLFITGASRGIGLAIGLRAARDGANICIAAKTAEPHPKNSLCAHTFRSTVLVNSTHRPTFPQLPGTIYTAAKEIDEAGGQALPVVCDVRKEEQVIAAIEQCVARFGGLDIVINNASAISLTNTRDTPLKIYDLMNQVNGRGTWLVSKHAIPHLIKSRNNPHILNISPPLSMREEWFKDHVAYTISKFNMSLCVLGTAGELRPHGVAVNALWPLSLVDTAAVVNMLGGKELASTGRTPDIMADAAHGILTKDSKTFTGNFLIDELFLREEGATDMDKYSATPGATTIGADFFIEKEIFDKVDRLREQAQKRGLPGNKARVARI
ncbi:LOW QUALITY PROTEIN: short chain dehydrogenase [Jimgerdemannia flammicorona]|uniref:Hydroxysteroid dehydrogenase-like protein 2 n=2 Tax=Jimgerdemannia flammicorona TaxID=994334 RepID=A0A433D427_9FUNG|nr:LOW QUALITY PROTEIN: short chain dehydrogenase [Jimgerdemannia flammicorona]RUS32789.1 LOW QUALITY PROTEIN: short chain dehydrogenase [Jimgerdemannia flammicorona]